MIRAPVISLLGPAHPPTEISHSCASTFVAHRDVVQSSQVFWRTCLKRQSWKRQHSDLVLLCFHIHWLFLCCFFQGASYIIYHNISLHNFWLPSPPSTPLPALSTTETVPPSSFYPVALSSCFELFFSLLSRFLQVWAGTTHLLSLLWFNLNNIVCSHGKCTLYLLLVEQIWRVPKIYFHLSFL